MKTKTDSGADFPEDFLDEDINTFNLIKEGLEDLNLYLAEIEKTYDKLNSECNEDYQMLTYKLSILENKMSELSSVLSEYIDSNNIDKCKLS